MLIAGNATLSLIVLALIYRPLVIECVDPGFMHSVSGAGDLHRLPRAGGDQPGVGLPCARHPAGRRDHDAAGGDRTLLGARHHRDAGGGDAAARSRAMPGSSCPSIPVPSGPAIILVAGVIYVVSLLFGRVGGLVRQAVPRRHLEA